MDCGDPPALDNGRLTETPPTSTTAGSTVTYECNDGYVFEEGSGAMSRTCLETGEWSSEDIKCDLQLIDSNGDNSESMPTQNIFQIEFPCITASRNASYLLALHVQYLVNTFLYQILVEVKPTNHSLYLWGHFSVDFWP